MSDSGTLLVMHTTTNPHVLDRLLTPVSRCLTHEVARALVSLRVDADTQAKLDELAEKCTEGRLSVEEQQEYGAYVSAIDLIAILQSKARALLANKPDAA